MSTTTYIINGYKVRRGAYPWHVGLYTIVNSTNMQYICGGTLLNDRVILTGIS